MAYSIPHSRGPWYIGNPDDDPKGLRKITGGDYGMTPVAQVVNRQSRAEEDWSNAQLIANAPKLLAIVKGFIATLDLDAPDDSHSYDYYKDNVELFNLAIDTIAELLGIPNEE